MSDWITKTTEQLGYWGVMLFMFLENVFPPIPSELVMPFAGFTAKNGDLTLYGIIAAGTAGSLLGVIPWYYLGRWLGEDRLLHWTERHGQWLTLSREEVERAIKWFDRWGNITVLVCRMVPGVRTLISIPAGFAEMPIGRFLLYSAIGTVGWTSLLAWLGWSLGDNYDAVDRYGGWVGTAVIAGIVLWWLVRFVRRRGWLGAPARRHANGFDKRDSQSS